MTIFDAHTHIGKSDPFHYSSLEEILSVKAEDLLSELDKCDVVRAVAMPNYALPHKLADANLALANSIERFSDRLLGFAWLDPRIEDCCKQLETLVKKHGFRGLKLHPVLGGYYLSNRVVDHLIERAIRLDVPVMAHTGWGMLGNASLLGQLAERFTDATFIMAHMIDPECVEVARRHENIYLETSYSQHPRRIAQATRSLGPERLIYGSDYPLGGGMKFEISKITLAEITDHERAMILGENISRLIE